MKNILAQLTLAFAFLASGVVSYPRGTGLNMSPVSADPFSSSTAMTIATTMSLEEPVRQNIRRPQGWYTETPKQDPIGAHAVARTVPHTTTTAVKSVSDATDPATTTMLMTTPTSDADDYEDYEVDEEENDFNDVGFEKRNANSFEKYKNKHKKKYSRIADGWASASQEVVDRRIQKKIKESLEAEELKTMDPKKAEKKRAKISKAIAASISHSMAWERVRTTKEPMWTSVLALAATTTVLSPKDAEKAAKKAAKQAEKSGLVAPTTTSAGMAAVQTTTAAAPQMAVRESSSSTSSIASTTTTVVVDVTQTAAPEAIRGTPIEDNQAEDDEIFTIQTVSNQDEEEAQRIRLESLVAQASRNAAESTRIFAMQHKLTYTTWTTVTTTAAAIE